MFKFTVSDFNRLGRLAGFRYRLPQYTGPNKSIENLCIAQGRIQEHHLRPGLKLVLSDIAVHQAYEATSTATPQLSILIMLQGRAQGHLEDHGNFSLNAQNGVSIAYGDPVTLTGLHPAGQRLRTMNILLSRSDSAGDPQLDELVAKATSSPGKRLHYWPVQTHLLQNIEHLMNNTWHGTTHTLMLEGVGLQVLGHALSNLTQEATTSRTISARDRQLLERVRERLDQSPSEDHSLTELARLACMSPSTLRSKFQAVYQCSVFDWLRERRLALARDYLAQGWSVQQAAHFVGYRHATNFATAFRKRYGMSPGQLYLPCHHCTGHASQTPAAIESHADR